MVNPGRRACTRVAPMVAMALAMASSPVGAGLMASPVRIQFTPKDRVVSLHLTNDGDKDLMVQTELFKWQQAANGQDVFAPAEGVVITPPILRIPAGTTKVLRMARLRAGQPDTQIAHRLFIHELAPPDSEEPQGLNARFSVSFSIPIFINAMQPRREVQCQPTPQLAAVECRNTGNTFVRVTQASVAQGEQPVAQAEGTHYLLPGTTKLLPLKASTQPVAGPTRLTVQFEDGSQQTSVSNLP